MTVQLKTDVRSIEGKEHLRLRSISIFERARLNKVETHVLEFIELPANLVSTSSLEQRNHKTEDLVVWEDRLESEKKREASKNQEPGNARQEQGLGAMAISKNDTTAAMQWKGKQRILKVRGV